MTWALLVALTWVVVGAAVALVIGRVIRSAGAREVPGRLPAPWGPPTTLPRGRRSAGPGRAGAGRPQRTDLRPDG